MRRLGVFALAAAFLLAGCIADPDPVVGASVSEVSRPQALLWSAPYSELVIEVDYLAGSPPAEYALRELVATAEALTAKTKVTLLEPMEIAPGMAQRAGSSWTLEEIYDVHRAVFGLGTPWQFGSGTQAFLHVIYLDSSLHYEYRGEAVSAVGVESENVLFVFLDRSLFAIGPVDGRFVQMDGRAYEMREAGILLHEFGHALGLVDNGIPMVNTHNKPDDPAHSSNHESIMAGGWDSLSELQMRARRGENPTFRFDENDREDIRAFRATQPS